MWRQGSSTVLLKTAARFLGGINMPVSPGGHLIGLPAEFSLHVQIRKTYPERFAERYAIKHCDSKSKTTTQQISYLIFIILIYYLFYVFIDLLIDYLFIYLFIYMFIYLFIYYYIIKIVGQYNIAISSLYMYVHDVVCVSMHLLVRKILFTMAVWVLSLSMCTGMAPSAAHVLFPSSQVALPASRKHLDGSRADIPP